MLLTPAKAGQNTLLIFPPNSSRGSRVRRDNLVAFEHLAKLPAGQDVCDAAILLNAAHLYFSHELAVPVDEQFAMFQHALILSDINDDKVPFRIGDCHLA